MPSFSITAAGQNVTIDDASGAGKAAFTVTNTSVNNLRGRVYVTPQPPAVLPWFQIDGGEMRSFAPGSAEQVTVVVTVPKGTPPATYSFRLDANAADNPDEDFTEGPSVSFEVAAPPAKKPFPSWILIVIALLVIGGGATAFLLSRGDDSTATTDTNTTTEATEAVPTILLEGEDLLPPVSADSEVAPQPNCCGVTWSEDAQAFWVARAQGQKLVLRFRVPAPGLYNLSAVLTTAPDYGIIDLAVDGDRIGSSFDGYTPSVRRADPRRFGSALSLPKGDHTLTVTVAGTNPDSVNFFAGIDFIVLKPVKPRLTLIEVNKIKAFGKLGKVETGGG